MATELVGSGRRRRALVGAGLVVAVAMAAASTTGCSSSDRQDVRATGTPKPATTATTATTAATRPPAFDEAAARYEAVRAPAGAVVGRAPATLVDDVALRATVRTSTRTGTRTVKTARRIRIRGGPFPYGDARVLVLVDGHSVGEGQVAGGGHTLTVAVLDPSLLHDGATIGYQVEPRPLVTVGTLKVGG